jgi:hypothetical protein
MSFLNMLRKLSNHIGAYKVHLCPEVKGQISDHGNPLANVKIERLLSFSDGKYVEDHAFTDKNGAFSLPEVNIRSGQPAVPFAEVFTSQAIYFTYQKIEYRLWISRLPSFKFRGEFADKLSALNADLKDEKVMFKFNNRNKEGYKFEAVSICRWKEDFEIKSLDKGS